MNKDIQKYRCECEESEFFKVGAGAGYRQEVVDVPDNIVLLMNNPEQTRRKTVCIDTCLIDEIKGLWAKGIRTTGCCCGHNVAFGEISVHEDDVKYMESLCYQRYYFGGEQFGRLDTFLPKTTHVLPLYSGIVGLD